MLLNRQIHQFKKVANCVNYKIKVKQSNFERNAKNIFGTFYVCWCYMYSGEYDVCDVTLSVHPHRAS